ncbi:phosphoglycerate mutase family protein [Patescibacteria group bacterium]|nr:phosphoglycerate mutase family protein [Patescibacteria group bacterium]MBU1683429.1 phosphoglycerate mutase family protein [Patescibacteria group bacterium]MBU1935694.1 phosphoglycerate mutase family protein [Patescibacteria group bacterium]
MNINLQNQFYVVRHGKAQNNELDIVSCKLKTQEEYGLTQEGKGVISNEAQQYKDFDIIFTSPFRRTQETASFFAKTSDCDVILDDRLVEFDVGDLDLKSFELYRDARRQHKENDYVYKNGESLSDAYNRLIDFIDDVNSQYKNKKILIVSHGVPAEILVDWSHGTPLRKWEKCIEKGKVFSLQS